MDENKPAPKKRGRKPLPPEEKLKRGRKKIVVQEINDRRQQGAPPLQISFVCDNGAPSSAPIASSWQALNPFHDHMNSGTCGKSSDASGSSKKRVAPEKKISIITALEESDDDETAVVSRRSRVDVSHLSGEKCIKLLGAHTDEKEWPSSTEVCCWNCTYSFDGIPIAIPAKTNKTGIFTACYGVFCSFNCARRYCLNRNSQQSWQQLELLSSLHKRILGQTARIAPAASFQTLERFGGYMTIETYRKDFVTLPPNDQMFNENARRDCVTMMQVNQIPHFNTVIHSHNQQLVTDSIQERKNRREGYDRTTPLPGSQNLAMSMGINTC
jgi:hypothetical protein